MRGRSGEACELKTPILGGVNDGELGMEGEGEAGEG